jgi:hypothetical protein
MVYIKKLELQIEGISVFQIVPLAKKCHWPKSATGQKVPLAK